jgi:hypothetical protein
VDIFKHNWWGVGLRIVRVGDGRLWKKIITKTKTYKIAFIIVKYEIEMQQFKGQYDMTC